MPAMQEQLQAMAMDDRYACNAGAIAGDGQGTHGTHAMWIPFMDGRYACNEGAIAGVWPWMAGMPAMQEQLQAYCQHCVLWRFATLCGMAKNIRISDALYDLATVEARLQHRSLAQQVEFWAKLGMAAERLGDGRAVTALDASLEATRRQDVLDVLSGKRRADYTYAIPRSVARRSKAKFRGQEP